MRVLFCCLAAAVATSDLLDAIGKDDCTGAVCGLSLLQLQAQRRSNTDFDNNVDALSTEGLTLESLSGVDWQELQAPRARPQTCNSGIRQRRFCCATSCGKCGGRGCASRPGGSSKCCTRSIERSGRRCKNPRQNGCIVPQRRGRGGGDDSEDTTQLPPDIDDPQLVEELELCDAPIDFTAASVSHSNLGGSGPDAGDESLVFSNVMPDTNLVITATSAYTPNSVNAQGGILRNDIKNGFGAINLASGSSVDLKFQFQDASTGSPKVLDQFLFTFFDADHGMAHESREAVTVSGFSSYKISADTALDVTETALDEIALAAGAGVATFTSTMRGGKVDNPTNPLALNTLQERRTVVLMFENKAEFVVSAGESGYANPQGRNIFFAGSASMVCSPEAKCSSYACPEGFGEKQDAEFEVCASKPCTAADTVKCCTATPPRRAGGGGVPSMGMGGPSMGMGMGPSVGMGMGM